MFKQLTKEEVIKKFINKHGSKYDYSKVMYLGTHIKVCIICPIHGDFLQTPHNHILGQGCPKCKANKIGELSKLSQNKVIEKFINTHGTKFDYSKVIYVNMLIKVCIICPNHGEFWITPHNHINNQGCPKCRYINSANKQKSNKDEFIQKAILIHGNNNDYSEVIYENAHKKIKIKCLKKKHHGYYYQKPNNHLQGQGCPICNASNGELAIKSILDKYNIKYIREYRIPEVGNELYYDFYLPEYNILIEFHGIQHYEYIPFFHDGQYTFEDQKNRDDIIRHNAFIYKYNYLEFNYKQLKYMNQEQFEEMVIKNIK